MATLQIGTGFSRSTINDYDQTNPYRSFQQSLVGNETYAMEKNNIPSGLLEGGQNSLLTGAGDKSYYKIPYN